VVEFRADLGRMVQDETRTRARGRARWHLWCAVALLVSVTGLQAADGVIRVAPLVRDGRVLVSFAMADGYSDEIREVIQSGLRTTFTYTIELRLDVPVWVDRVVDTAVITNTVQYDNLTRRHTISRALDGRVEEAEVTDDEALVREWLTAFDRVPLFRTSRLEANRDYYVVIRASARPRSSSPFWPWGSVPTGSAKFTFIP
jgi:hypothetical protein